MALLDVARENAAKILGVEVVKLPASLRCVEEQVEKTLKSNPEERVRADPVLLKKPPQVSVMQADILVYHLASVTHCIVCYVSIYNGKRAFVLLD